MSDDAPVGREDAARDAHLTMMTVVAGGAGLIWGFVLGGIVTSLIFCAIMIVLGRVVYRVMVVGTGKFIGNALVPDARGGVGTTYSHIVALEAKGDIPGALRAWEDAISDSPDALAARLNAAELYTRKGNDHARAAVLYREVQLHEKSSNETKLYVSQKLIDLYLGPLGEQGRALVELRKLAEKWPGTREADGARQAILKIKGLQ